MLNEKNKQAQNEAGAKAGESQTAPEAAPVQEGKETPPSQAAPVQDASKKAAAPKASKKTAPHKKAGSKVSKKTAPKASKKPAPKADKKGKRDGLSGLDAAAKILGMAGKPLHIREIFERMLAKKMWKTGGKTPSATISAAIIREIHNKKAASRFRKAGRGLFELKK